MATARCDCPRGCNSTCYDSTCTVENAAVGKVATASTVYTKFGPCLAVDGITDVDNCMETAQGDLNPFWRVDLGQEFIVHFMTVHRRSRWSIRMEGLKIYVDEQLCDVIDKNKTEDNPSSDGSGPPVPINITCSTPLTGRYVTLVKYATNKGPPQYLETLSVCEVQVWGELLLFLLLPMCWVFVFLFLICISYICHD
ncbi:fucolectin-1-like [Littorina saxatilis]|uniref:fucolectin-1-like n=1 Tax=Littorina saxatilis TaxID=31220 RepID=UPI0038B62585